MAMIEQRDETTRRFERLARAQMSDLYKLAKYLTRSREDAEDLVQETCLRALKHFDRFQPGTNFRAWTQRILKNAFVNHYHKKKVRRHVALESVEYALQADGGDEALGARVDAHGTAFRAALESLSPASRQILLLASVDGLTYREIAEVVGCPIGTVMSRLSRARRRVRHRLQAGGGAAARRAA